MIQSLDVPKTKPDLVIRTKRHRWVIPHDCQFLSLLLEQQGLHADDLQFRSEKECYEFIRTVFLLSIEHEFCNKKQSPLAVLGRHLVSMQARTLNHH